MFLKNYLLIVCCLLTLLAQGQQRISLLNPSLEGVPRMGALPESWSNCGPEGETPPDIQPSPDPAVPFFGVQHYPLDGESYLSLSIRDNGTTESIGQLLGSPLQAGKSYHFQVFLAQSQQFRSSSRTNPDAGRLSFTEPAILQIWAGNAQCQRIELLGTTAPVSHEQWYAYSFELSPATDYSYLTLEAFFDPSKAEPYNGHLLIDHLSPLTEGGLEALDSLYRRSYSAAQFSTMMLACGKDLAEKPDYQTYERYPYSEAYYVVAELEKVFRKMEFRQFLTDRSVEQLSVPIKCLDQLGFRQTADYMRQMARIQYNYRRGIPVEETEFDAYEQSDERILEIFELENPAATRNEYIEKYRNQIAGELASWY